MANIVGDVYNRVILKNGQKVQESISENVNLPDTMVHVENISFTYDDKIDIYKDFDWKVGPGEAWAILGPSGCGKTTMLYLLAGVFFPNDGRIFIDGTQIDKPRMRTGLILQDYGLLPWGTVRQNVELGIRLRKMYGLDGRKPEEYRDIVDSWLKDLGIDHVQDHFPGQVSIGQRQRVAIARSLVLDPDLLLMDEPFSSLDAPTRESLQNLTTQLWVEQNLTMIIVTHAIEEAVLLGKKILLLGHPPNTNPVIIDNPKANTKGFRSDSDYHRLCRELRQKMDENTNGNGKEAQE
jgi:ABC-type nitrate/sulfonate/bicarbonate transport system ATPase subunit